MVNVSIDSLNCPSSGCLKGLRISPMRWWPILGVSVRSCRPSVTNYNQAWTISRTLIYWLRDCDILLVIMTNKPIIPEYTMQISINACGHKSYICACIYFQTLIQCLLYFFAVPFGNPLPPGVQNREVEIERSGCFGCLRGVPKICSVLTSEPWAGNFSPSWWEQPVLSSRAVGGQWLQMVAIDVRRCSALP